MDETLNTAKYSDYRYSTSTGLNQQGHHDENEECDETKPNKSLTHTVHSENENNSFTIKDGGSGWLVVIASCWCFGIIISMQNSYSLLYNSIIEKYKNETNHVAYAG